MSADKPNRGVTTGTYPRLDAKPKAEISVLVVDDEFPVLDTMLAVLELNYVAIGTTRPQKALDILATRKFNVLIVDWQMPEMDGMELFRRASKLDPTLAGLLMTGYMDEFSCEVNRSDRKMLGILAKPFSPEQLTDRVEQLGRLSAMKNQIQRLRVPA
jgi:DNA-binding NtrC family response regulator